MIPADLRRVGGEFGRRALRVLLAAAAAAVVAWPVAGFTASTEAGPSFRLEPSLRIGGVVLAVGLAYAIWLAVWALLPRAAAGRLVAPVVRQSWLRGASAVAAVAALAALPTFVGPYWTGVVLETMVFAVIAVGLSISMGMAGLLVLGHAAFWAVGSYTFVMTTLHLQWNFWLAFPAAGLAAAVVGLLLGIPALRLRGDYLAIVTMGFGEAIKWIIKNNQRWTGGDAGIPGSEVRGTVRKPMGALGEVLWQPGAGSSVVRESYWFALGLLVVCIVCVVLLTRSRFGRALYALREDETAARCMGIDTVRVKLIAFMASAMWAGLAGVVHPIYRGQITPEMYDFNASVLFVAMVVLGGLGSVAGAVAGAAILHILPLVLRNQFPAIQEQRVLVFGAVLAAMMVVRPEGLLGRRDRAGADAPDPAGEAPA